MDNLEQKISDARTTLEGLRVLALLKAKYSVRFRFLDSVTGFYYFEVSKLGSNHAYTVRIQFVKSLLHRMFSVRERVCNCMRFTKTGNCHHFLVAAFDHAEGVGFGEIFDLEKFANYQLAKVYQKELEVSA